MDYNVYKVQNSINHMLNPSADRDVNNSYQLSTEKARNWWNMQGFESRKNVVIESDAVINDDELVVDQTVSDIADKDYDDLPDITKQEVELQVEDEEGMEELFEVKDDEYLKCSTCEEVFTSNEDYESHKSVDHGEEPEDFEDSFEAYQLTMHPELTRESLREANDLLKETKPTQLYSGYDKNGDVQSSIMPYNLPPVATGKYDDNPNEFFYSNKIFRAGDSALRTSSLGENVNDEIERIQYDTDSVSFLEESPYFCKDCNDLYDNHNAMDASYASKHLQDNPTHNIEKTDGYESKASEGLDFFEKDNIIDDSPMEEQLYGLFDEEGGDGRNEWPQIRRDFCNGNTDIESLVSGVSNQRSARGIKSILRWADKIFKSNESKANEDDEYEYGFIPKVSGFGEDKDKNLPIKDHTHNFTSGYKHSNGIDYILQCSDSGCGATKNQDLYMESKANEKYGELTSKQKNVLNNWLSLRNAEIGMSWEASDLPYDIFSQLEEIQDSEYLYSAITNHVQDIIFADESTDKFEADIENDQVVQKLPDDKRSFDVEATEKGEWDWLDKGADNKSVDYDEVEYKDDGVSDISIQNAEPKGADANEFLDNVSIGLESVDFVYKTKASEAMEKTYIPVSETLEGDYEEFEDSDEEMIEETITLRKLTGYGDDAIARELHINYGVSHEEALEKVYSVEVSTNDRVSQTFFGKMYKECTESEKDELQMYSGSD